MLASFLEAWTAQLIPQLNVLHQSIGCRKSMLELVRLRMRSYWRSFAPAAGGDGAARTLQFPPEKAVPVAQSALPCTEMLKFDRLKQTQFEIQRSEMPRLLQYTDGLVEGAPVSGLDFELAYLVQNLRRFDRQRRPLAFLEAPTGPAASIEARRLLSFALTACKFEQCEFACL